MMFKGMGGVKDFLNNVKKNCTFLTRWLPKVISILQTKCVGPSFILREELSALQKEISREVNVSDKPELTNNMFFTLLFAPPPVRYTIHCRCAEALDRPSYQNKYREEK